MATEELTKDEKKLLSLAMGVISLQDLITSGILKGKPDAQRDAGRTYIEFKAEFDKLFDKVDQDALIEKLK